MSDIVGGGMSDKPLLSDSDLRDRIAAALMDGIADHASDKLCRRTVYLDGKHLARVDGFLAVHRLADAVIEELSTVRCWKCDNTVEVADDE